MSLNVGASTVIEYFVTNAVSGLVNDAAVTVTIKDNKGVDLVGETWPFTLPYGASPVTDGVFSYNYTFDPFINLIAGQQYTIIIDVVGIDGLIDQCIIKSMATVKNCLGGC